VRPRPSTWLPDPPILAILRGIAAESVPEVVGALWAAGIRMIEVPLGGAESLAALRTLVAAVRERPGAMVGAGTVRTLADVDAVVAAGGRLVVSPHLDRAIVEATRARGLLSMPGVATPTEAFAALDAGAHLLKLYPGEMLPPAVIRSWRAVFPPTVALFPVGGVGVENAGAYRRAGATGIGVGGAVYRPGWSADRVRAAAEVLVEAWRVG
jgi:2-dehydro-3-deoxyphosphogalactonate aldolase